MSKAQFFIAGFILGLFLGVLADIRDESELISLYRKKTVLRIVYDNGIPVDTMVILKDNAEGKLEKVSH